MSDAKRSVELAKKSFKPNKYELAVEAIEHDICDRRGIKNDWFQIDYETQQDIKNTWRDILKEIFCD